MIDRGTRTSLLHGTAYCLCAASTILLLPGTTRQAQARPGTIVSPSSHISDAEARAILARCESALGHAKSARRQYRELLRATNTTWRVRFSFAEASALWGDFYGAERLYREFLATQPGDRNTTVKLADILAASQQFERAEGLYRQLLFDRPDDNSLLVGLANIKSAERDFDAALEILNSILARAPRDEAALAAKGTILLHLHQFDDAIDVYNRLTEIQPANIAGNIGIIRALLGHGGEAQVVRAYVRASRLASGQTAAHFYANRCARILNGQDPHSAEPSPGDAGKLLIWAELCQAHDLRHEAIACLEKALDLDAERLPAQIALAQALAVDRQFDRSLEIYEELGKTFPESYKILIEWARVLSWARKYEQSLNLYERISDLDPRNAVPVREHARVAAWAKRMDQANESYARLLDPPVDTELLRLLPTALTDTDSDTIESIIEQVRAHVDTDTPHDGYEWLYDNTAMPAQEFGRKLQRLQLALLPLYRIQKAAFLEWAEKRMAWRKRYLRARGHCQKLILTAPGNQEALYDLSQHEFALRMHREAVVTTTRLLNLDPAHSLAPAVLKKADIIDNVYLRGGASYWHETGRGELVDIKRQQRELVFGLPMLGRGYVESKTQDSEERPGSASDSFKASAFSVQAGSVVTPWLEASAGIGFRDYTSTEIANTKTYHAQAKLNLVDVLTIDLRHARADAIYNQYSIRQGIQADEWMLAGHSFITRDLEITALGQIRDYSDNNSGEQVHANMAYAVTDHPHILKGAVFGELRDTDEMNQYLYDGDTLVDIIHPYWTPEDYQAWGVIVEWYHDLSPIYSRGTDSRLYDVSITLRDDTDNNQCIELKGKLHWEWKDRWALGVEATLIRSRQWDAEGVWTTLQRHF